jgi:hypothetical protein
LSLLHAENRVRTSQYRVLVAEDDEIVRYTTREDSLTGGIQPSSKRVTVRRLCGHGG